MTKLGVICEQLERLLKGVISGDRRFPTRPEIALHVRQGLGYVIKGDAFESSNIDGLIYANDQYNLTLKNVPVLTDGDGVKYSTFSNLPITLPRGRGIVSIRPKGKLERSYEPILRKDLDTVVGLTRNNVKRRVMYFQEGSKVFYHTTGYASVPNAVDKTIVCSPVGGMNEELNISDDVEAKLIEYVLKVYGAIGQKPVSENTDGIDVV
jgi:hypothetical protein